MALTARIFGIAVMGLLLLFTVIHIAVSIGIIVPDRQYSDIFRPQIGLAAFNLVISIFGLATGVIGLASLLMNKPRIGKIAVLVSGGLGLFALASLISALVINSKSLSYVSSHFSNNMYQYKFNPTARDNVDRLQMKYKCCGTDLWLDWSSVELNATASTSTSTVASTTAATTTAGNIVAGRQAVSTYGGILGLPISFLVTLPGSCCSTGTLLTGNTSASYCVSIFNSSVSHFYINGCSKLLDVTAGNQAMGIGVINCFMIVLAFVAIPLLLESPYPDL